MQRNHFFIIEKIKKIAPVPSSAEPSPDHLFPERDPRLRVGELPDVPAVILELPLGHQRPVLARVVAQVDRVDGRKVASAAFSGV